MNVILSYNWLQSFLSKKVPFARAAELLTAHAASVERIFYYDALLGDVVVGRVQKIVHHPNADRLVVADVEAGKRVVQVVCGGTNVREGMLVALALSGAKVRWHGAAELVMLKTTDVRGVKSEGMICAAAELGLESFFPAPEREIMDLGHVTAKPGTPLAVALDLTGPYFEIETTTNRPDLLSVVGLARELATLTGTKLKIPTTPAIKARGKLSVKIAAPKLCARYTALKIDGVKVAPSPAWLQQRLRYAGIRPISNIVDITNYVMLEMGQPLHAFDAHRFHSPNIVVRNARAGEEIAALDGKTYALTNSMLVIADGTRAAAIAGVMGGQETAIVDTTTSVILEAATFDPVFVRRTSRALNLRSESSARFERGLSTEALDPALLRAAEFVLELAGGTIQAGPAEARVGRYSTKYVTLSQDRLDVYMGEHTSLVEAKRVLAGLGFQTKKISKTTLVVGVPYWRDPDVAIEDDLIEEIARMRGYDNIPSLPLPGNYPRNEQTCFTFERIARAVLVGAGFTETISTALVPESLLKKCGCNKSPMKLSNPLSDDLAVLSPTLVPSMLAAIALNERIHATGSLFELQKVYRPQGEGKLPAEPMRMAVAIWGTSTEGQLFFRLKGLLALLAKRMGVIYELGEEKDWNLAHPGRASAITIADAQVGHIAEIHPGHLKKFDIRARVGMISFDFDVWCAAASLQPHYLPPSQFPPIKRDLAVVVPEAVAYSQIEKLVKQVSSLVASTELFDVYRGEGIPSGTKSLALHLVFLHPDRTLNDHEVDTEEQKLRKKLTERLQARFR